jgi:hypothetical protein
MIFLRKYRLILFILFSGILLAQQSNNQIEFKIDQAAENIKQHTEILASDNFSGRGTGSNGGTLAAEYIAKEFAKYGLQPVGNEETFYQNVPMHGSFPLKTSELKLFSGEREIHLNLEKDYLLFKSGQQTFTPVALPIVFVGYGIVAPEFDYNDYQSIDVEGKIVVFLDGEPESDNPDFFNGPAPTIYKYPSSKQRIALARGAAGSILIPNLNNSSWANEIESFAFEDVNLAYSASNNLSILINPELADTLFQNSGYSFARILKMKMENKLESFLLNIELSFKGEYIQRDFLSQNIAGMLEGNDPDLKDSYLIISAHYDHLGTGPAIKSDSIYNGALDNAIGVAVLLELANQFSQQKKFFKRSILFLALTGEEKGLLGSTYYTVNPIVPLYKTIADLNIDGVAMFRDFKSVVGVGAEYSSLEDYLLEATSKLNLEVDEIPPQFEVFEAFNQSDQLSFAEAGIPSILVLEGIKNKHKSEGEVLISFIDYMVNRYHSPIDDLSQNIDYLAAAQHAEVLYIFIRIICNSIEIPEWNANSPFLSERLRTIAEKR